MLSLRCCIFWPAFECRAPQMLVKLVIFCGFCANKLKKCKKVTNLLQNLVKKQFAPKRWSTVLFPRQGAFSHPWHGLFVNRQWLAFIYINHIHIPSWCKMGWEQKYWGLSVLWLIERTAMSRSQYVWNLSFKKRLGNWQCYKEHFYWKQSLKIRKS